MSTTFDARIRSKNDQVETRRRMETDDDTRRLTRQRSSDNRHEFQREDLRGAQRRVAEQRESRMNDRRIDSRRESRDTERRLESRNEERRESRNLRRESRKIEEDVDFNPKWNFNISTFDFYPSSKEVLSQFLLGGIALAMLFKKEGTKTV